MLFSFQKKNDPISEHSKQDHNCQIVRKEEHARLAVIKESERKLQKQVGRDLPFHECKGTAQRYSAQVAENRRMIFVIRLFVMFICSLS